MRSLCSYGGEYPRESLSHDLIRSTDGEVYKECSFPLLRGGLDVVSSNCILKRIYFKENILYYTRSKQRWIPRNGSRFTSGIVWRRARSRSRIPFYTKDPSTPPPTNPSPSPKPTSTPSPSPPTASVRSAPAAAAAAKAGWTCFMARTRSVNCTGTIVTRNRLIGLRCRGLIARSIELSVVDGVRGLGPWDMFLLMWRLWRLLRLRLRLRLLLRRGVFELFELRYCRDLGIGDRDREFGLMIFVYSVSEA